MAASPASALELFWIPLGAGGHFVRFNGRVYEALTATLARRERRDLFHAALIVAVDGRRYAIELAPTPRKGDPAERGVVVTGPVGARWAGRSRLFRYEIRCARDGTIPDLDWAVGGPLVLGDPTVAYRLLECAPRVPRLVWGRDEHRTGDMWNSNSVISWLLEAAGIDAEFLLPPAGGRAPGWHAGVEVARRQRR